MADETASPAAEESHLEGLPVRIPAVFTAPGQLFTSVNRKSSRSDWLVPLLLVALTVLIASAITMPVIQDFQMEAARARLAENPNMSPEKQEQALEMIKKVGGITGLIAAPLMVFVMSFLQALVFMGVANFLLGGSATYGRTLTVVAYAGLIVIPTTIVTVPLILAQGSPFAQVGLNLLMSKPGGFLYGFLALLNVFAIWQYAVIGIGLAAVAGVETRKATIVVFVLYVLYAAGASALAGLSAG